MDSKYNALFTPWKIGKVEIPNRIVQCSMGGTSLFGWMEPCHLDKEAAYFLLNRAKDGVGLILPGMQCIKDAIGGRWLYQNDKMFKDLKVYMEEFHKTGAKLFVQLAAGIGRSMAITKPMVMLLEHPLLGKLASPVADLDYITASASATPNRWYDEVKSRPMTIKEIQDQVEAFAKTSKKLMDAGVDGVEIHAVHEGYLLDQFTISNMNYRTDQYGGSFENRFRFPVEIVQAIKKAACGPDFPVSLRYSVVSKTKDWGKGAMPYEKDFKEFGRDMEESERAVKYLADAGYDMFNCDNGTYDAWYWAHPPQYMPDNVATSSTSSTSRSSPTSPSSAQAVWILSRPPRRSRPDGSTPLPSPVRTSSITTGYIRSRPVSRTRSSPASAATTAASTWRSSPVLRTSSIWATLCTSPAAP